MNPIDLLIIRIYTAQLARESRYLRQNFGQESEVPEKQNIFCHPACSYGLEQDKQFISLIFICVCIPSFHNVCHSVN